MNSHHFSHLNIMEKRCRPEAGHFKQLNDIQLPKVEKRRVKQVIVLPDDYIVERIVAKLQRQNSTEYLVNWAGYRPEEATWEPAAHIPDWLLEDFEKPCQDEALIYDCRERLSLTFERGLKARLVADFNIEMKHAVFRALFPMIKPALSSSWQEITEEDFRRAGFQLQLEQIVSRTGLRRKIVFPILVQLSLGRSPTFFDDNGQKAATRRVERVRLQFRKMNYFP